MSEDKMTPEKLIEGLKWLDNADQGMRYHGGGYDRSGPKYDSETGEKIPGRYKSAELTIYGDRAKFLYELIRSAPKLAKMLELAK